METYIEQFEKGLILDIPHVPTSAVMSHDGGAGCFADLEKLWRSVKGINLFSA